MYWKPLVTIYNETRVPTATPKFRADIDRQWRISETSLILPVTYWIILFDTTGKMSRFFSFSLLIQMPNTFCTVIEYHTYISLALALNSNLLLNRTTIWFYIYCLLRNDNETNVLLIVLAFQIELNPQFQRNPPNVWQLSHQTFRLVNYRY